MTRLVRNSYTYRMLLCVITVELHSYVGGEKWKGCRGRKWRVDGKGEGESRRGQGEGEEDELWTDRTTREMDQTKSVYVLENLFAENSFDFRDEQKTALCAPPFDQSCLRCSRGSRVPSTIHATMI